MEIASNTLGMNRADWLKARRRGLGGSDAGAIAGLNPWVSPVQVWMDKTGQVEPSCENEFCYWGNVLEDVVAKEFSRRTGLKVRRRNAILKHPEHEWMLANVDRLIVGTDEGLECKTASAYMLDKWKDGRIPESYEAQIQHYMAVTGYSAWWIAVLIGGNTFKYQRVERDDEFIGLLIDLEKDFWETNVIGEQMPDVDGTSACTEAVKKMFPDSDAGSEIHLSDQYEDALKEYARFSELEKRYKEAKDEMANKLKVAIGDHEKGFLDGHVVTWKGVTSNRFDSKQFKADHPELFDQYAKESTYRRFAVKAIN